MLNQLLRPDDPWLWLALEVTGKATLLLCIAAIVACYWAGFLRRCGIDCGRWRSSGC